MMNQKENQWLNFISIKKEFEKLRDKNFDRACAISFLVLFSVSFYSFCNSFVLGAGSFYIALFGSFVTSAFVSTVLSVFIGMFFEDCLTSRIRQCEKIIIEMQKNLKSEQSLKIAKNLIEKNIIKDEADVMIVNNLFEFYKKECRHKVKVLEMSFSPQKQVNNFKIEIF